MNAPNDMMTDVENVDPSAAFAALSSDATAMLIDVRTVAEWSFVGAPDLSGIGRRVTMLEWQSFPSMALNPDFTAMALSAIAENGARTAFFLCRSGVRSLHAARAVTAATSGEVTCINVAGGFEGDPDGDGRRGRINGWKAAGLPWRQN